MDSKSSKKTTVNVSAQIICKPNGGLMFREFCGTATDEETGDEFECSHNLGAGAPVVRLPDGRFVVFPWQSLVCAAIDAGERFEVCQR